MKTLVTNQGTATPETALCETCYLDKANQGYAREMASRTDDIDPKGNFVDCTGNEAVDCCICGKRPTPQPSGGSVQETQPENEVETSSLNP